MLYLFFADRFFTNAHRCLRATLVVGFRVYQLRSGGDDGGGSGLSLGLSCLPVVFGSLLFLPFFWGHSEF